MSELENSSKNLVVLKCRCPLSKTQLESMQKALKEQLAPLGLKGLVLDESLDASFPPSTDPELLQRIDRLCSAVEASTAAVAASHQVICTLIELMGAGDLDDVPPSSGSSLEG